MFLFTLPALQSLWADCAPPGRCQVCQVNFFFLRSWSKQFGPNRRRSTKLLPTPRNIITQRYFPKRDFLTATLPVCTVLVHLPFSHFLVLASEWGWQKSLKVCFCCLLISLVVCRCVQNLWVLLWPVTPGWDLNSPTHSRLEDWDLLHVGDSNDFQVWRASDKQPVQPSAGEEYYYAQHTQEKSPGTVSIFHSLYQGCYNTLRTCVYTQFVPDELAFSEKFTTDPIWLLGSCYALTLAEVFMIWILLIIKRSVNKHGHIERFQKSVQKNFLWFTYRKEFPLLLPYNTHSDVGWGCTLRSGQMMLSRALSLVNKVPGFEQRGEVCYLLHVVEFL